MVNKTKRNLNFNKMLSYYEKMCASGVVEALEENTLLELISYYDAELQIDKAIEAVDLALVQFQHRADFYMLKANLLFKNHMFNECLDVLTQIDIICPSLIEAKLLRGKILSITGQTHVAFSYIHELLTNGIANSPIDILLCEAFLCEWMADYDKMFSTLKKALLLEPENQLALDRMWVATQLSKNHQESILVHNHILDQNPYNANAWFNLGHSYESVGEYDNAIDALEYAFIVDSKMDVAYADCVDICFQQKEYQRALSILLEAQQNFDSDFDTLINLGRCYIYVNDLENAKKTLKEAVVLDKYQDEAFYLLAKCYLKEKKWNKALYSLNKAIAIESENEDYFKSLARVYVNLGDFPRAKQNYELAAQKGLEQSVYWEEYISFLLKIGEFVEAREVIHKAEQYTYSDKIVFCKAATFFKLGNKDRGLICLEEALAENPDGNEFFLAICPEYKSNEEMLAAIKYFTV